jgi:hypothetical protein
MFINDLLSFLILMKTHFGMGRIYKKGGLYVKKEFFNLLQERSEEIAEYE